MNDNTATVDDDYLQDMLPDFLDEADGILAELGEQLLVFDEAAKASSPGQPVVTDAEKLNEMFRAAHTLKGLSGMLGLREINTLTHKMENVFDASRNGQLPMTAKTVDVVFHALDKLLEMINGLKDGSREDIGCEAVVDEIRGLLSTRENLSAETATSVAATTDGTAEVESNAQANPTQENKPIRRDENPRGATTDDDGQLDNSWETAEDSFGEEDPFAGIADDVDISSPYVAIFIDECDSTLSDFESLLTNLDADTPSKSLVLCHRIKGSAASIGLNQVAKLAHFVEDLLEQLLENNEQHEFSPEAVDSLFGFAAVLADYVEGLRAGEFRSGEFCQVYHRLLSSMSLETRPVDPKPISPQITTAAAPDDHSEHEDSQPDEPLENTIPVRADIDDLGKRCLAQATDAAPALKNAWFVRLDLKDDLAIPDLTAQLIFEKMSQLGEVFYCCPEEKEFDTLQELSTFCLGVASDLTADDIESKAMANGVTKIGILPIGSPETETQGEVMATGSKTVTAPKTPTISVEENHPNRSATPSTPTNAERSEKSKPAETVRVDIDRLDQLMNLAGQLVINKARFSQIGTGMKHLVSRKQGSNSMRDVFGSLKKLNDSLNSCAQSSNPLAKLSDVQTYARRIQSEFESIQRRVEQLDDMRTCISDLLEATHQLDRVSDGIQKCVMDTRMVPIGPLFGRFKRVIRDISRSESKEIRLEISGEKTELDKRMIDELSDPLIHIIRNSADHGIESPDDREAAGKPREGTVILDASHRGNSIVIQIVDDGKGLDANKLRSKAIERGLLSEAEAEKMSDHQAFQLIWEAGLSTADKITSVSGRGMGMDIVRSKIEDISGTVELESKPGVGTTITIKLPLTLAILPSLLSTIDDDVFAVPVESVSEIVCVPKKDLSHVHGLDTAIVRGRVISVVKLSQLFEWSQSGNVDPRDDGDDTTLVIVESDGQEVGLVVHGLLGEEDVVIKSLAENYRNVDGIAGASILGDGRVSLILDVCALIQKASQLKPTKTAS